MPKWLEKVMWRRDSFTLSLGGDSYYKITNFSSRVCVCILRFGVNVATRFKRQLRSASIRTHHSTEAALRSCIYRIAAMVYIRFFSWLIAFLGCSTVFFQNEPEKRKKNGSRIWGFFTITLTNNVNNTETTVQLIYETFPTVFLQSISLVIIITNLRVYATRKNCDK